MDMNMFKDTLFDLINECDQYEMSEIESFDWENVFVVRMEDKSSFKIQLSEVK